MNVIEESGFQFEQFSLYPKRRPTKRAPDVWDSAAFSGIFYASSFSCSQAESTPAHTQVTRAVRHFLHKQRNHYAKSVLEN